MPRLDRYLSARLNINRKDVRLLLAQRRIEIDGVVATDIGQLINNFSLVRYDSMAIQDRSAHYLMLNKPAGIVSATVDARHTTVIDLLDFPDKGQLHIVGRLDFNSTGLLLLTNDGAWSKQLSLPENNCVKRYRVTVAKPLTQAYVEAFEQGMHFEFEDITTRPAKLCILSDHEAEVSLTEGRYHQIKRMFGRFNNKVLGLHRVSVGSLVLEPELLPGEYRALSTAEVSSLAHEHVLDRCRHIPFATMHLLQ